MTRKHFVAIAAMVARIPNEDVRRQIAFALAELMESENPRFRPGKFLAACNVVERKKSAGGNLEATGV